VANAFRNIDAAGGGNMSLADATTAVATKPANRRYSNIEALRGVASIGVALFHFSGQLNSAVPLVFQSVGWLGVDVFFVISGFVIPLSLYGRDYRLRDFPHFMLRRLVRLEPPYFASIALGLLLWYLSTLAPGFRGTEPDYSFGQIAFHFFYAIPLTSYSWLSPVYWSLAYEFVFYIIVGLTFSFLINREIEFTILAAALIGAVSYYAFAQFDVKILEFTVGILLLRLVVNNAPRLRLCAWLAVCLAGVFWTGGGLILGAVLLAAGTIYFLRDVQFGRWAYFVGGISYSLYLTHTVIGGRVINLGRRFGEGALYEALLVIAALAVAVLFSVLFARFIEAPARHASHRIRLFPANAPSR
jgi:peptidoglycan/LPS O-acetylase OafA/YrhL